MSGSPPPHLDAAGLAALASVAVSALPCSTCSGLACVGWESIPGGFDRTRLRRIGTLRPPGDEDPTTREHHPGGTNGWSRDAPIAPAFFPYNRCDVWQCAACGRPFLRYTEYGGYYQDERIRALGAALIVDAAQDAAP